jgi:hypothetical protein
LLKAYIAELESLVTQLEEENAELLREQVTLDSDTFMGFVCETVFLGFFLKKYS